MYLFNGKIFTPEGFLDGGIRIEEGIITAVIPGLSEGDMDLGGAKVIPGLVDIHTHGNSGADFSDGNYDGLRAMASYYAINGITSFTPTSMTLPYEKLHDAFMTALEMHANRPAGCARVVGIHMEGPFLSARKKGAQNSQYLQLPDIKAFESLYYACNKLIRIVDIAPELEGAVSFTEKVRNLCTVSIAHTDAGYEQASAVFDAGAAHLTHLFNAMPPIHHRSPGVIQAASERENVYAELICDGLHVHPSAVRMAFKLFPGRICLISDSLRCCGMPEGEYELGDQRVYYKDGAARLADGTLAGATANLYICLLNAINFGIPEEDAINAATIIPARTISADPEIGSIEPGKKADLVICDNELNIQKVMIGGEII